MDSELASRPGRTGFEGCRQVTGYDQLLHDDLAPVSFFQGTKTDSWQNYIHQRLDIGVFLSLDNDDEIDIFYFAGNKYHQTRESSFKITKCLHRKRPRQSITKESQHCVCVR